MPSKTVTIVYRVSVLISTLTEQLKFRIYD